MPVRKVGRRWLVDIRYRGERIRVRSPGTTKADAQAHETYLRGEIATHGSLRHLRAAVEDEATYTFAEFAAIWMREHVLVRNRPMEQKTKESVLRSHLLPALGAAPLDTISAATLVELQDRLRAAGLAPKTVNNYLGMVHTCLASAAVRGLIVAVPSVPKLRVPQLPPRNIAEGDLDRLLTAAQGKPLLHAMISLASSTGLRFSELVGLRWEDVDLERRLVCVRRADVRGHVDGPKNGRARFVPMNALAFATLDGLPHLASRVLLFRGHPVSYKTAHVWLKEACLRAGLPSVGWHALRHTFASDLVSRGASLYAVRDLLGHSSTAMTARYAHLAPEYLRSTVELLDAPRRSGHPVGTLLASPMSRDHDRAPMLARISAEQTAKSGTVGAAR